jgi:hypothetical protein
VLVVEEEHVVKGLAPQAADKSFAHGIHVRGPGRLCSFSARAAASVPSPCSLPTPPARGWPISQASNPSAVDRRDFGQTPLQQIANGGGQHLFIASEAGPRSDLFLQ